MTPTLPPVDKSVQHLQRGIGVALSGDQSHFSGVSESANIKNLSNLQLNQYLTSQHIYLNLYITHNNNTDYFAQQGKIPLYSTTRPQICLEKPRKSGFCLHMLRFMIHYVKHRT
jgi:hypothetical protein